MSAQDRVAATACNLRECTGLGCYEPGGCQYEAPSERVPNEFEALPDTALVTREHAFAAAQNAVRNQGYAVAIHGSRVRDLDLVAIPWQETALGPKDVAELIADAIPGVIAGKPEKKPHGRVAFTIYPRWHYGFDRWYVDLSVMPRRRTRTAQ